MVAKPTTLNLVTIEPSKEGGWQQWLDEMTQEPDMYAMSLIGAWDVRYSLNHYHAHIIQCAFDDGQETFHMHNEDYDEIYVASFQIALEHACWYLKGGDN